MPLPCSSSRAASGRAASVSNVAARQDRLSFAHGRKRTPSKATTTVPPPTSPTSSAARQLRRSRRRLAVATVVTAAAASPRPGPDNSSSVITSGVDIDDRGVDVDREQEGQRDGWNGEPAPSPSSSSASTLAAVIVLLSTLAASSSAFAEEGGEAAAASAAASAATDVAGRLHYDPSAGSEFLRNAAGAAYVVLLVIFAFRLLRRRADFATSTRIARGGAGARPGDEKGLTAEQRRQNFVSDQAASEAARKRPPATRATPLRAAWGALQAGACALLLWQVCTRVDAFFEAQELPAGYTAHNIAVTLRTVGRGLSYLLTFIFAANAAGLGGLAVQLIFFPEPEVVEGGDDEGGEDPGTTTATTTVAAAAFSNEGDDDDAAALRPLPAASPSSSEDEAK